MPGLRRWLAAVAPSSVRGTISVAVVSDRRIRDLNRCYRGHDEATDVLSFPVDQQLAEAPKARRRLTLNPQPLLRNPFLGDIVIARGVARRQARAVGHSDLTELRILALHGLLHLIGYDHERDSGLMRRVERRLRRTGGLREGLMERAAPRSVSAKCEHASSRPVSPAKHSRNSCRHPARSARLGARGALLGRAPRR